VLVDAGQGGEGKGGEERRGEKRGEGGGGRRERRGATGVLRELEDFQEGLFE
jgi:hypothetical protein